MGNMGRVIPAKFLEFEQNIGVESLRAIKTERVKLSPFGVNTNTPYSYNGLSRVLFRVPSFANAFLDNSNSFLSFKMNTKATSGLTAADNLCPSMGVNWIQRVLIKNSSGLVVSDETNYDVISRILQITKVDYEDGHADAGIFGKDELNRENRVALGNKLRTTTGGGGGVTFCCKFNTSIVAHDLKQFLPLFLMDNAGYAFDIELFLAPPEHFLTKNGSVTGGDYEVTNPVYNLALLRLDESTCAKFKDVSSGNDKITIPFTVYRAHPSTISAQNQQLFVHELSTNIKRVWTVIVDTQQTISASKVSQKFHGSIKDTGAKVISYNYRVGNQWVYNEPVEELENGNNSVSLNHVKSATFSQNKPTLISGLEDRYEDAGTIYSDGLTSNYESNMKKMFVMVAPFDYSSEALSHTVQGISTSTPIEFHVKFSQLPYSKQCINVCELGFNLVINRGVITYEEQKGGSNQVY